MPRTFANQFFFHPSIEQGGNTGNVQTMSGFAFKACRLAHFRQNLVQAVNTYGYFIEREHSFRWLKISPQGTAHAFPY